ncbi:uncharacterized protein LOC129601484 [Paramacrobiotus metropolitanus]|uniref:uncharacterized protein LOC129601484 n=1 Tax=Paramacrobiotus metropolitanus TaxID=2943436 RepID=UPI002445EC27|nr:uncharacterized protein LOC129601484 [Paramacrobiotus metropolitanus]
MEQASTDIERFRERLDINNLRPPWTMKVTTELLGRGNSGFDVCKAEDRSSGQEFAVKLMRFRHEFVSHVLQASRGSGSGCIFGPAVSNRFEIIRALEHSNIVKYYFLNASSIGDDFQLCIFMERCSDVTLEKDMQAFSRRYHTGYEANEVVRYFADVASGLRYLHSREIVHGELCPENLIFSEQLPKLLKITDCLPLFDWLEKGIQRPEAKKRDMVSPYRAPEEISRKKGFFMGRRGDVWSLACILVFMLQGRAPYSIPIVLRMLLKKSLDGLAKEAFSKLIARCIDGDFRREARYGNEIIFLIQARSFLQRCMVFNKMERPYMDAVCDHDFIKGQTDCIKTDRDITDAHSSQKELEDNRDGITNKVQGTSEPSGTALDPRSSQNDEEKTMESIGSSCRYKYNPTTDKIGQGPFGAVYKAEITARGDFTGSGSIAVKAIYVRLTGNVDSENCITSAAKWRQLLQLRNKNIVRYYKISCFVSGTGAAIELLMDYFPDGDLACLINVWEAISEEMSLLAGVSFALQISWGLSYLHSERIIHGDLKPANVLVRSQPHRPGGYVMVIGDLDDRCMMTSSQTCTKDVTRMHGTTRYMSPEMVKTFVCEVPTDRIGRKTDVWSLGCIIIDLVDGLLGNKDRWLHRKGTEDQCIITNYPDYVILRKLADGFVPLLIHSSHEEITALIEKSLCSSSKDRITSVELSYELEKIFAVAWENFKNM